VLGLLLGLFRAEASLGDSDVLWGARAGLDMLRTGHLPRHDFYSWTVPGKAWIPNSWGWNLVLGITYKAGGLTGIFVLGILLTSGLCLVIGWFAKRLGADPARTVMIVAVMGMLMRCMPGRSSSTTRWCSRSSPWCPTCCAAPVARPGGRPRSCAVCRSCG
jgi:hypothetical protein